MASYGYKAVNSAGKEIKGSIEADSEQKARSELKAKDLTVLSIGEQGALSKDINIDIGGKPKARDLSIFCRQFVSMIRAGVSILNAMRMLEEQTENKRLKKAVIDARVSVEKGETLADSLAQHPKEFPEIMFHMVAAGEASGSLDVALERLAVQFEKSAKTAASIKKAMIYPIAVGLVALIVIIVMLVVVIPRYSSMFDELGSELPRITVITVAISDFVIQWWYLLLAGVIVAVFALRTFATTYVGKHFFGKLALRIPVVKDLVTKSAASQMTRTLSTLLAAGVPMIEATNIVANTLGNIWFKEAMLDAAEQIAVGVPISTPLETCGLFPPMVYHMTRIGEESGDTEGMLTKIADYYDEEVEIATQSLMAAMEPLIIIILAVIVAFLIATIMGPMLQMYNALDQI